MTTPAEPFDLSGPLRVAILGQTAITDLLASWQDYPAVFTSRPVPAAAPYPQCLVSPQISRGNQDYLTAQIGVVRRDISFYGNQPDDYRTVEALGFLAFKFFHRNKFAIDLSAQQLAVIDIVATGPISAPVDDENKVGRLVALVLRLRDLST